MGVLAKATVFWNTWKSDSLVVGISKCFNSPPGFHLTPYNQEPAGLIDPHTRTPISTPPLTYLPTHTYICEMDMATTAYTDLFLRSVLESLTQVNKAKNLKACLEQRRTFVILAYTADSTVCSKAHAFKKCIAVDK